MEKKHDAHEIGEQSKVLRWLDNFWFHYKWQTIAVLLVVILLAVTLPQCGKSKGGGIVVTLATGNDMMSNDEQEGLKGVLSAVDENSRITLGQYSIFTEEELIRRNTYKDPVTGEDKVDLLGKNNAKGFNQDRIKTLQNYIMTGDCGVWIVSPYVYGNWFDGKIQVKADLRLGDLPLFEEYGAVRFLSPDCRVILTRSVMGETSRDRSYEQVRAYYEQLTGTTVDD